jgi:hypothetical protein
VEVPPVKQTKESPEHEKLSSQAVDGALSVVAYARHASIAALRLMVPTALQS